jgi:hypothetical protein
MVTVGTAIDNSFRLFLWKAGTERIARSGTGMSAFHVNLP